MAYNPNNPNGQATMANSAPVVIASDQTSVPINDDGGSITVDGTVAVSNFPATQPISGTVTVQQAVAANLNATVTGTVAATQSGTWNLNNISGTISLPTGAATETTLSAVNTKIPSGLTVTSTRLLVDGSGVTQPVSGTVTANAGTGNFTVVQPTASNLNATITGSVSVSNFPATQPVSGTVAATQSGVWSVGVNNGAGASAVNIQDGGNSITVDGSVSVSNFPATQPVSGTVSANLNAGTNYVGRVRLTDGTTDAEVVPLTGFNAQAVAIVDGSGNQITSFGGGTQYADGTAVATPTGTVALGFDGANVQALSTTAGGLLNVADGGGSITVDGTVTANAGTGTFNVSGTVAATQSGTWVLGANSGVDIGDVTINNAAGAGAVNIQDGGNSITVDGTVAATQSGTWNIGTLTSITNAVTVSGTVTASNTSGDVANDSPDSGNPVKIGFKADALATLAGAVANNDRVDGVADRYGRQLVNQIDPSMQVWRSAEYTSTQTGTNIWVPTAGNRFVITSLHIATGGTTAGLVTIWGAQTATTAYTPGTDQVFFRGVLTPTANATPGALIQPSHPFFSDTTNDCLKITTSANMTVYIQVNGYEITP